MFNVHVQVTYKDSVLDPQGQAVQKAIERLGFEGVSEMRIGKSFEMQVADDDQEAVREKVAQICDQLLANPNMEQYHYDIQKAGTTRGNLPCLFFRALIVMPIYTMQLKAFIMRLPSTSPIPQPVWQALMLF